MYKIQVPSKDSSVHFWVDKKIEVLAFWRHGELIIINSICPHMGGQLEYDAQKGKVFCPWHGLSADPETCLTYHKKYKSFYRWKVIKIEGDLELIPK